MSYCYTGTPALKTDFTRTGKRTYRGAIDDGINAVTRYYINNFTDGYFVDCLDFLTQRLTAEDQIKKRNKFFTPLINHLAFVVCAFFFVRYFLYNHLIPQKPEGEVEVVNEEAWK